MAAEIVCSRWTALVLREMLCGTTRFNDLRRGVPRMSPTLLSKRLKELGGGGRDRGEADGTAGVVEYRLTDAGEDLRAVIMSLGIWGQRWVESSLSLKNLDPSLLMWDMRRNLVPAAAAAAPLHHPVRVSRADSRPEMRGGSWSTMARSISAASIPGFEVDLYVRSSLRSMTAVWMGCRH